MTSEYEIDLDWIAQELGEVSLGDTRLDWRLIDIATKFAAKPSLSINQACDDLADTRASYRLFDNKKTTAEKILSPHYARVSERIAGQARVLAIQDTSYLDYTHHPEKEGMGPIGTPKQGITGLVMHSTLMMSEAGTPLGLAHQAIWARSETVGKLSPVERRQRPIEEKESHKWLEALDQTVKIVPKGTQVISVGDSEADIFEFLNHARSLETDVLIRAAQNRSLCEPEVGLIRKIMGARPVAGQLKVHIPARNHEPKRKAIVTVRFSQVTLKAPQHLKKRMEDIPLYAVLIQEEAPPPGVDSPLNWLLLTTVPVLTLEDAVERIQWYRFRWQIEVYHKILKSGCQVEKTQLATAARLLPYLALFGIIAWRMFWMTIIARQEPDAPCTIVLTEHEWHALYAFHHKSKHIPDQTPTVAEVVLWIAQLGGFLARKNDGHPGVTVVWRGWQRLTDISAAWLIFYSPILVGKG